jgi:hypothetical protein
MTVDEITEYQKTSTTELQDILNAEKSNRPVTPY